MKTTLRFSFGLFVACGLVLGGCERKVDKPSTTPPVAIMPPDSAWVYQNKAHRADVAIVFVHGIFGDARDTWTNANGQTFFDLIHDHPNVGKPVDVFTFGFPSGVFDKGAFDVQDASKSLRDKLLFYGVDKYESVVFVAHSMGGLVVMRTLITYPELRRQTPLVALYGTPQEGAQVSTIATRLTGNPALK